MGGWYKLDEESARQLAVMQEQLSSDRNRTSRNYMILFLWAQMLSNGKPCPHFKTGTRTLANRCGVSDKTARALIESAERAGWIVQLGESRDGNGRHVRRTFRWVAEEAAENDGISLDEWLLKVGGVPLEGRMGVPLEGRTPTYQPQQKRAHGCALGTNETAGSEGGQGALQSTEYSEGDAARLSLTVEALANDGLELPPLPDGWQP